MVGKQTVVIPLKTIHSISKEKVLRLNNGIKIRTGVEESDAYLFSFFSRDEPYDYIMSLWDIAMEAILRKEEGETGSVSSVFTTSSASSSASSSSSSSSSGEPPSPGPLVRRGITAPQHAVLRTIKDKDTIKAHRTNSLFQHAFHLPEVETVVNTFSVKKFKVPHLLPNASSVTGTLYLSKNFFCFQSSGKDSHVQLAIPYAFIKEFKLDVQGKVSLLKVTTSSAELEFQVRNREAQMVKDEVEIMHRTAVFRAKGSNLGKYFEVQYDEKVRELRSLAMASPSLAKKSPEENQNDQAMRDVVTWGEWEDYFRDFGHGFSMIRTPRFVELINTIGIPDQIRGVMWQLCSGSTYLRYLLEGQNYYASLLKQNSSDDTCESVVADEIEKDLHRSLPEHTFYQSQEGIDTLRRVLLAYSVHNREIGYCQAMNIIAALLLLYMSEEAVFYLLCMLCEVLMPRSYSKAMIGAVIDQNLFEALLQEKIPDLHAFLNKKNVPVPAITMGWFICLFISYLPFHATLRIMDSFFVHGVTVLYKAALTIMFIYKPRILAQKDGYMVASMLKVSELDITAEDLFLIMDREFKDISAEHMETRRKYAKYAYIREMQSATKNSEFGALLKATKFTNAELEALYDSYQDTTKNDSSKNPLLNFKAFIKFMKKQYPWWEELTQYERNKLFVKLTQRHAMAVSFNDVVKGLDPWIHGGITSLFTSCFRLFDLDDDDQLTFEQLVRTFDMLYRLATHAAKLGSISSPTTASPSLVPSSNLLANSINSSSSSIGSVSSSKGSRPATPDTPALSSSSSSITKPNMEQFAIMIYDKLELQQSQKVSFVQVKTTAFDTPLFVGFFGVPS